jgi:hypothetical protein
MSLTCAYNFSFADRRESMSRPETELTKSGDRNAEKGEPLAHAARHDPHYYKWKIPPHNLRMPAAGSRLSIRRFLVLWFGIRYLHPSARIAVAAKDTSTKGRNLH